MSAEGEYSPEYLPRFGYATLEEFSTALNKLDDAVNELRALMDGCYPDMDRTPPRVADAIAAMDLIAESAVELAVEFGNLTNGAA